MTDDEFIAKVVTIITFQAGSRWSVYWDSHVGWAFFSPESQRWVWVWKHQND